MLTGTKGKITIIIRLLSLFVSMTISTILTFYPPPPWGGGQWMPRLPRRAAHLGAIKICHIGMGRSDFTFASKNLIEPWISIARPTIISLNYALAEVFINVLAM
jgi:hypothetical protein